MGISRDFMHKRPATRGKKKAWRKKRKKRKYILEGKELEFYMKKLQRKKGKGATA